jgi:hypothetical protein
MSENLILSDELIIQYWNNEITDSNIGIHFKFIFDCDFEKVNEIYVIHTDIYDIHVSLKLPKITINAYINIEQLDLLEVNNSQNHLFQLSVEFIIVDNNNDKLDRKIDFNDIISKIYIDEIIHIPFVESNILSDKEMSQSIKFFNMLSKIVNITYTKYLNIGEIIEDDIIISDTFNSVLLSINNDIY